MVARAFVFVAALALAFSARADQRPTFSVSGQNVLIALPTSVLDDAAVRKQLNSGLTTTFLLSVRRREEDPSGARVEVRYDLWDEVWHVRRVDAMGTVDRQRIASREALEKWWRTPVRLFASGESRIPLDISLAVLPFSSAEEEDARQWIAKSGGVGTGDSGSGFIDALIGTTLESKPITTFRWRIELAVSAR